MIVVKNRNNFSLKLFRDNRCHRITVFGPKLFLDDRCKKKFQWSNHLVKTVLWRTLHSSISKTFSFANTQDRTHELSSKARIVKRQLVIWKKIVLKKSKNSVMFEHLRFLARPHPIALYYYETNTGQKHSFEETLKQSDLVSTKVFKFKAEVSFRNSELVCF